jgi:hypothetical protein
VQAQPALEHFAIADDIVYSHVPHDHGFDLAIGMCDGREYVGNEHLLK